MQGTIYNMGTVVGGTGGVAYYEDPDTYYSIPESQRQQLNELVVLEEDTDILLTGDQIAYDDDNTVTDAIDCLNDTITNKTLVPISSENIQGYTSGSASYLVRSGYCVVSFNGLKMSSGGTISNVPKCLMYSTGFVTTGQVTPNVFIQIEGTNMTIQGNTSPIYGTVIYPLDLTV